MLFDLPLYIDDSPGVNITQVRSKARRLKKKEPDLGLIVVDYIGLMSGDPGGVSGSLLEVYHRVYRRFAVRFPLRNLVPLRFHMATRKRNRGPFTALQDPKNIREHFFSDVYFSDIT